MYWLRYSATRIATFVGDTAAAADRILAASAVVCPSTRRNAFSVKPIRPSAATTRSPDHSGCPDTLISKTSGQWITYRSDGLIALPADSRCARSASSRHFGLVAQPADIG